MSLLSAKPAKKAAGAAKKGKGIRYSPEQKQQVVDFVNAHNQVHGRGGQNQAAKKFRISVLTVAGWLKAAGAKKPTRKKLTAKAGTAKKAVGKVAAKASGDLAAFKAELLKLIKRF